MTRVYTEGFEMGDILSIDVVGNGAISTTQKRSGAYSLLAGNTPSQKNLVAASEFYFRFGYYPFTTDSAAHRFIWRNSTTELGSVRFEAGHVTAYTGNSTGIIGTGALTLYANTWYLVEVYVKIADSGGRIVVKIDGTTDIDFTGDSKPGTATTIDNIQFSGTAGQTHYFDDIAVNDTNNADGLNDNSWCGDGHIVSLYPTADVAVQLTGSDGNQVDNYALVDEVPLGTGGSDDYVQGTVADERDLYALSDTGWTVGTVTITRVYPESRSMDTVAAGGTIQLGILAVGGSEDYSTDQSLLSTYGIIKGKNYKVNPQGGAAWSTTDVDGVQICVKTRT